MRDAWAVEITHHESRITHRYPIMNKLNLMFVGLLLGAGIVYLFLWPKAPERVMGDTDEYIWTAKVLESGNLPRPLDRVPGFPALLVLTGSGRPLYYVLLFFHLASIALLLYLMQRLGVTPIRQILFALVALSPGVVSVLCGYIMTESMTEFFLVLSFVLFAFWFVERKNSLLIPAAILVGLSALVRPSYQMIFVPIAALILLVPGVKKFRSALVVVVASVIILGSYVGFNGTRFGFYGMTPLIGFNLCTRTARVLERLPAGPIREILIRYRNDGLVNGVSKTAVMYIWKGYYPDMYWPPSIEQAKGKGTIPELMAVTQLNKAELSKKLQKMNVRLILSAPLEYIRDVGAAGITFWFPESTSIAHFGSRKFQLLLGLIHAIVFTMFFVQVAFLFSATIFLFVNREFRTQLLSIRAISWQNFFILMLALVYVLYTFAISTLVEVGNPRYRAPVDLLIFFFVFTFSIGILSKKQPAN
jgi:hypothetical protein